MAQQLEPSGKAKNARMCVGERRNDISLAFMYRAELECVQVPRGASRVLDCLNAASRLHVKVTYQAQGTHSRSSLPSTEAFRL